MVKERSAPERLAAVDGLPRDDRLFGPDPVAPAEEPGARDHEQVRIATDRWREGGERPRHAHDLECRRIEQLEARGAVELDRVDAAVRTEGDGKTEIAIDLAAGFGRIVDRPHALHLGAPVLLVLGEAVLRGVGADEFLTRTLLVVVERLVDLSLQAHGGKGKVGEIAAARTRRRLLGGRSARRRLRDM